MATLGTVWRGPARGALRSFRLNPAALAPWVSPLALLALWYWAAERGFFPEQILVPPGVVLEAYQELTDSGELQEHLQISLYRLTLGFAIGALTGLVFGVLLALSRQARDYAGPLFHALRQIPTLALIPMFILFFGIGETLKIVIIVKATFFPVAVAAWDGVKGIPGQYLEVGRLYRLKRRDLWLRLVLPAALPSIFTGLQQAVPFAWITALGSELLFSAGAGLGSLMMTAEVGARMDIIIVCAVTVTLLGMLMSYLVAALARYVLGNGAPGTGKR